MTAHKHAEMIKAKADNMDLVVLYTLDQESWFMVGNKSRLPVNEKADYFLCHPNHADVCLHWLNGVITESYFPDIDGWGDMESKELFGKWTERHLFMNPDRKVRIKPSKEKRWIGVNTLSNTVTMMHTSASECRGEITDEFMLNDFEEWQFIEIEVEV